ncbi:MAG: hypothetical protein Q8L98_06530 [Chlamydiales bacterium]|nr:hypothetical protein [Chlamydiales bacterium]
MSFVVYGTPADQFSAKYPFTDQPFSASQDIRTHLPKNIAIIRAVAAAAFAALIAFKVSATIFFWPVTLLGASFAAQTLYSHLYVKDPLVEAFYTIVGGKEAFEDLPQTHLLPKSDEKICNAISRLDWEKLEPITRASTPEGRVIILIKSGQGRTPVHHKAILSFIEKVGPNDIPRDLLSELTDSILHAVSSPFKDNTFGRWIKPFDHENANFTIQINSSISGAMANEFFAQLRANEL